MSKERKSYDEQLRQLAEAAYTEHRLVNSTENTFHILRYRDDQPQSMYWTEIVLLRGCRILVHGDVEPVMFQSGDYTMADAVNGVQWAADAMVEYLVGKVIPSVETLRYTTDSDVAVADIQQYIREYEPNAEHVKCLRSAMSRIRDGDELMFIKRDLYEGGLDAEWLSGLGKVIDARVYYAHAALKRLAALLAAESKP